MYTENHKKLLFELGISHSPKTMLALVEQYSFDGNPQRDVWFGVFENNVEEYITKLNDYKSANGRKDDDITISNQLIREYIDVKKVISSQYINFETGITNEDIILLYDSLEKNGWLKEGYYQKDFLKHCRRDGERISSRGISTTKSNLRSDQEKKLKTIISNFPKPGMLK